jgi:hypothetical protein
MLSGLVTSIHQTFLGKKRPSSQEANQPRGQERPSGQEAGLRVKEHEHEATEPGLRGCDWKLEEKLDLLLKRI